MTNASEWSGTVGRSWADEWRRTDRSFSELTARLVARIAPVPGTRVVDVGCGAGELALAIAGARPDAQVVGVDISADLIATAEARRGERGNAGFVAADVTGWAGPGFAPDLLVSRHGVMFFDDPVASFAHLGRLSAPGARLMFSCFGPFAANAWAREMVEAIAPGDAATVPDPLTPGPFAFADPQRVRAILESAGWGEPAFEGVAFSYIAGAGEDPVSDALDFFRRIGPAAARLRALPEDERRGAESRLRALLDRRRAGSSVRLVASAWIVSARRAGESP